jgi:integral membrane sensor domain MASE1
MIGACLHWQDWPWPLWTLVQVLSYVHVLQLTDSTFAPSFRHMRTATVKKIYTRMNMQDLIDDYF